MEDAYLATGAILAAEYGDASVVTGQLADLALATGTMTWLNAGHPLPLLVRGGRRELSLPAAADQQRTPGARRLINPTEKNMKTTQQFAFTFVVLSLLGSRASAAITSTDEIFTRITTGRIVTDGGQSLNGTITFISPRAEFTPRNVQTAEERSKLVYRIKVTTDNRDGVLKTGMPVEGRF